MQKELGTEFELIAEGFTQILFRWSSREKSNIQRQICVGIAAEQNAGNNATFSTPLDDKRDIKKIA